jgi:hypothetical protein
MRHRRLTLGTAALAAGALAVPALAPASGDGGKLTLEVIARTVDEAELDLGEEGFGIGDQFVFTEDLFRTDGRPTGQAGGSCTVVRADEPARTATVHCVATLAFPRGQVTVQGLVTFTEEEARPFTIAVTGGTGRYQGAGGEMVIDEREDPARYKLTLHLPKR